jgi:hypothetical protein
MQQNMNKPFDTNPYVNQGMGQQQINTQVPTQDLGVQNVNPYYNQQNMVNPNSPVSDSLLGTFTKESTAFDTQKFLMGALIGAAGAYLLTNEKAQKAIFKTVAKGGAMFSAGLEEMKERFEDAQAELEAEQQG